MIRTLQAAIAAAFLTVMLPLGVTAQEGRAQAAPPAPMSKAEEGWYQPLRYDADEAITSAEVAFRRHEESAAANELERAVSWLQYAAKRSEDMTRATLAASAAELASIADDLHQGHAVPAASLDAALGRASNALARWHVFMGRTDLARDDELFAAMHVEAAARDLRQAARAARHTLSDGAEVALKDIDEYGDYTVSPVSMERVSHALEALERELDRMAWTMRDANAH